MSRLAPIAPEQRTPAQAAVVKDIEARGGRLSGPYTAYIRIPEFMDLNQRMGDYLRKNSLAPRLRSLIVLRTVGHWGAKYAWAVNKRSALKEGMADIVATTGFYSMVSFTLNAFEVDPPKEAR